MRRFILILMMLSALVLSFSSCSGKTPESPGTSALADDSGEQTGGFDLSTCSVITASGLSDNVNTAVDTMCGAVNSRFGLSLSKQILTDSTQLRNSILICSYDVIGDPEIDLDTTDFRVFSYSSNIVIYGKNETALLKGIKRFMQNNIDNIADISDFSFTAPGDDKIDSYIFPDLHEVVIEKTSTVYCPSSENNTEQCTYGKIIKLEHSGDNNGQLLATRETCGGNNDHHPIYLSRDGGNRWASVCTVRDTKNAGMLAGWQPFLYELPAEVGDYKEGTVLLAACSRSTGEISRSIITLYASTNSGRSFTQFVNIDEKGGIGGGMWEPYLIYEEKTGRIYCFYSEDAPELGHSQRLVYKYSTDLINWSDKKEAVSCRASSLRPGMVSIAKMGNGQYIMVFEMVGMEGNPIYCKFSDDLDNWEEVSSFGKKIKSDTGKALGSAPWCAWTPAGGECGTLFVTGMFMSSGESKTGSDMFVSFDYGKTFKAIDNPIPYKARDGVRCGYSAGLYVDKEGTVYYVNNTNFGAKNEKMIFAEIKVK